MEKLFANGIEDLVDTAVEIYFENEDFISIAFCCKYDLARKITEYIIREHHGYINNINLLSDDYEGYNLEYYVFYDGEAISVEPAFDNGRYLSLGGDHLCFIDGDCNSKIITINDDSDIIEFSFDDECDGDCENCEYNKPEDKKEITKPETSYKVNGKEVSKSEYDAKKKEILDKVKEFDDDYMDMVRDSLLARSHMMDLYSEMLKTFM